MQSKSLTKPAPDLSILRLSNSHQEQKISEDIRKFTYASRADQWAEDVKITAERSLEQQAKSTGADLSEIKAAILLKSICSITEELKNIRAKLNSSEEILARLKLKKDELRLSWKLKI